MIDINDVKQHIIRGQLYFEAEYDDRNVNTKAFDDLRIDLADIFSAYFYTITSLNSSWYQDTEWQLIVNFELQLTQTLSYHDSEIPWILLFYLSHPYITPYYMEDISIKNIESNEFKKIKNSYLFEYENKYEFKSKIKYLRSKEFLDWRKAEYRSEIYKWQPTLSNKLNSLHKIEEDKMYIEQDRTLFIL